MMQRLRRARFGTYVDAWMMAKLSKIARTLPGVSLGTHELTFLLRLWASGTRWAGKKLKLGHGRRRGRGRRPSAQVHAPRSEPVTLERCQHPEASVYPRRQPPRPLHAASGKSSCALRVVYEIHLIGGERGKQQPYDLRSTMYFAIAIRGIAASPYGTTLSMASWYNRSASALAPSKPINFG